MEEFRELPDFPGYSINDQGHVYKDATGRQLSWAINQAGIPSVAFGVNEGPDLRRSVALLVAQTFLESPKRAADNTPIHLNGDRTDCRASNLMWRPRWFAVAYHKQFTDKYQYDPATLDVPVKIVDTGELFDRAIDVCMKYGVLAKDIVLAIQDTREQNKLVPPVWFEVAMHPNGADIISRRKRGI